MHWTKAILPSKLNLTKLQMKQNYIKHWEAQTQKQSKNAMLFGTKKAVQYGIETYKVTDKKTESHLVQVQTQWTQARN